MRGSHLGVDSAKLLAKVATPKRVMLFGIKHDQTEANFRGKGLGVADAILIASDLSVSGALTDLNLANNRLCGVWMERDWQGLDHGELKGSYDAAGITAIAEALRVNGALTSLSLPGNRIGGAGAKAIGEALRVNGAVTQVRAVIHHSSLEH